MGEIVALAGQNLVSPIILSFVLGLAAVLARSDLSFPEAVAKGLSLYLLFAIGFKGGTEVAAHGIDARLVSALLPGVALSFLLPFLAFTLLRLLARVSVIDAAAVAAHYGSISIIPSLRRRRFWPAGESTPRDLWWRWRQRWRRRQSFRRCGWWRGAARMASRWVARCGARSCSTARSSCCWALPHAVGAERGPSRRGR